MKDETKAAADAALVESMVQQLRDCVSVGDEMTLDHAALIDDAADWIAGEPARQAAAVAAAREEQREACARDCEDGESCRCDNLDSDAQCGHCLGKAFSAAIRATPLTATPLADRIAELEAERDALQAMIDTERERVESWLTAPDGRQYERGTVQCVFDECDDLRAERDEAVTALRLLLPWVAAPPSGGALAWAAARQVLAKYPEGR